MEEARICNTCGNIYPNAMACYVCDDHSEWVKKGPPLPENWDELIAEHIKALDEIIENQSRNK